MDVLGFDSPSPKDHMDAKALSPASGADQIAALRAELDQRDATIELLAQQLEEAANRLDWISRCGSDREPQSAPSGKQEGSTAHAGIQPETAGRLDRFLEQWEQVELGESLERIDRRLSHVFELLKSYETDTPASSTSRSTRSSSSRHSEPAAEVPTGSLLSAFLASEGQPGKAQAVDSHQPVSSAADSQNTTPSVETVAHDVCFLPLPEFIIPDPVELHTADIEALRSAVISRDECIQQLIARARIAEANRTSSPDWKSLESIPEEFHKHLIQLELDLRQTIKQEELSGSIERAKISRERVHLDSVRKELELQIRRLGEMQIAEEVAQRGDDGKPSGKRWGKVFGR